MNLRKLAILRTLDRLRDLVEGLESRDESAPESVGAALRARSTIEEAQLAVLRGVPPLELQAWQALSSTRWRRELGALEEQRRRHVEAFPNTPQAQQGASEDET